MVLIFFPTIWPNASDSCWPPSKQATELERRMLASEQRVTELNRVLDETAVSYRDLQQEHAATLEELAWYKRWAYGRRRERLQEDQGQGHLFELDADFAGPNRSSATAGPRRHRGGAWPLPAPQEARDRLGQAAADPP